MDEVTVILTSCNRLDLLDKTIMSFLDLNTYPILSFHVHNDGPDTLMTKIKKKYPMINWHCSPKRRGYSASLDFLLEKVKTPWVFTCEDDWWFYQNRGFMEKSLKILKEHKDVHQVWIRDISDHNHPHGDEFELSGIRVRPVIPGYRKIWNGFSLNPGLRRMSDLKAWFPNGLREYGDEANLAARTMEFNYKAVSLVESSIKHLGWNRRSINFKA